METFYRLFARQSKKKNELNSFNDSKAKIIRLYRMVMNFLIICPQTKVAMSKCMDSSNGVEVSERCPGHQWNPIGSPSLAAPQAIDLLL